MSQASKIPTVISESHRILVVSTYFQAMSQRKGDRKVSLHRVVSCGIRNALTRRQIAFFCIGIHFGISNHIGLANQPRPSKIETNVRGLRRARYRIRYTLCRVPNSIGSSVGPEGLLANYMWINLSVTALTV